MFLRLVLLGHRITLPAGGGRASGRHTLLAQHQFPRLALGLRHRGGGLCITRGGIGRRREVGMMTISTRAKLCIYRAYSSYIYLAIGKLSWTSCE